MMLWSQGNAIDHRKQETSAGSITTWATGIGEEIEVKMGSQTQDNMPSNMKGKSNTSLLKPTRIAINVNTDPHWNRGNAIVGVVE